MTITKLENIFNIVAQNMPEINFYHFGWLQDINDQNLQNNFNPPAPGNTQATVNYPALYCQVYAGTAYFPIKIKVPFGFDYSVELRFVTTQQSDNDQNPKDKNRSEFWSELQLLAAKFIGYFNLSMRAANEHYLAQSFKLEFDSEAYTPQLAEVKISFSIGNKTNYGECLDTIIDSSLIPIIADQIKSVSSIDSIENNI